MDVHSEILDKVEHLQFAAAQLPVYAGNVINEDALLLKK